MAQIPYCTGLSGEILGRDSARIAAQLNGPDNGVCTSGRGLADASKGVD